MNYRATNLIGQPIEPHTAIFPILKQTEPDRTRLVGTGFFITNIGHFVTAKHVIRDVLDKKHGHQIGTLHALHFVRGNEALVRHITKVCLSDDSDVAVGKMDFHATNDTGQLLPNFVPNFTLVAPRPGSRVVTYAYPESDWEFSAERQSRFRPNFCSGEFVHESELPRDRTMVAWPHFCTSMGIKGGASGGPVFDEWGRVFGVHCIGGDGGLSGQSYEARVAELLPLEVPECPQIADGDTGRYTVYDLARRGHIVFDPDIV